jgi:PAS domain S-box-containing protein
MANELHSQKTMLDSLPSSGQTLNELILVVDDDSATCTLVRRVLQTQGYKTIEAADGIQAVQAFQQYAPSIILMDAQMPRMNGFEACRQIRALPNGDLVAIIMITSMDSEGTLNRAYEAGATDYLVKPIHWAFLNNRLHHLIAMSQTAATLEERHNLLRILIDNLPDYIFVKDLEGRFIVSNAAHSKAAGLEGQDEIVGKPATGLFRQDLAAQFEQDDHTVIETGVPLINVERETVDSRDRTRQKFVLTTKVPLRDRFGQINGLIGISRDITERKLAEEELRRAHADLERRVEERTAEISHTNATLQAEIQARQQIEQQQARLIEGLRVVAASAGELILCRDVDALYREAVDFIRDRLGLDHIALYIASEEGVHGVYGTHGTDPTMPIANRQYPLDCDWAQAFFAVGAPESRWLLMHEGAQRWGDGDTRASADWMTVIPIRSARYLLGFIINDQRESNVPLDPVKQEMLVVFGTMVGNLIEQKEVEGALSTSQNHLQRITDNMLDIICQADISGAIAFASPSCKTILGFSPTQLIGRPIIDRVHPDDMENVMEGLLTTGRAEYRYLRADGSYIWLETLSNPLYDNTTPTGYILASREITERKRAEQELLELNRLKTEFLSTAAHELRTPLVSIRGFSEILLNRNFDSPRQRHFLTLINEQSTQLGQILDDLLDISRLEAKQRLTLQPEQIALPDLIGATIALFDIDTQHPITFENNLDFAIVIGDRMRIAQVLKNLLNNAIKYSPHGGPIKVRLNGGTDRVQISVTDQGIGMTEEQASHLFEKFFRADASNTAIGGTGLGLAICKLIIELHGGALWAESRYGEGSTFFFTLPADAQ